MVNHILDLDYNKNDVLVKLFKTIANGDAILFLGAGASVSDKKNF